jgi:hypothetical protein
MTMKIPRTNSLKTGEAMQASIKQVMDLKAAHHAPAHPLRAGARDHPFPMRSAGECALSEKQKRRA